MKKLSKWMLCLAMIISLGSITLTNTNALSIVQVDQNSTIAKEFAFQPCVSEDTKISIDTSYNHFNDYYTYSSNFTQPVSGDDYYYKVDLKTNSDGTYKYEDASLKTMPSIRYLYENVGMYDGETVNARVTLSNIYDTYCLVVVPSTGAYAIDPAFDHSIYIDHAGIGFCAGRCHVEIEFLKEDGTIFHELKGNMTGTDLDSGQGVYNVTGVNTIYYKNNTIITSATTGVQSNGTAANGMYDENGQFLMLLSGGVVTFDWCMQASTTTSRWSEGRYISFQKAGFLRNVTPGPTKEVDQEQAIVNEYNGQELLHYTISQYVPYQPIGYSYNSSGQKVVGQDYHYTKFQLIDSLPELASVNVEQIRIVNENDDDVTDYFNISLNENQLKVEAKTEMMKQEEFYVHTYIVHIDALMDENQLYNYTTQGTFVENEVQLIYSQYNIADDLDGGKDRVVTKFVYSIDSISDQGSTITPSMSKIQGGSKADFEYQAKDGYYISGLIVDGKEVDFAKQKGVYTFGNISAYHTIEVKSSPYYVITTEVINGTITPNVNQIEKGEDVTIEYHPDQNCYLERIAVDQNEVDLLSNPENYQFNNIEQNHHIQVVYQPYQWIKTEAINGTISGNDVIQTETGNQASYTNLKNGSDVLVNYEGNKGCYLEKIIVEKYSYNLSTKQYDHISTENFNTVEALANIQSEYKFNQINNSYKITVVYRNQPIIKITKTIQGDYNLENGIPVSIFKIEGVDYQGNPQKYYRVISFDQYIEEGKLKEDSITIEIDNILPGIYSIEEINGSRYQLDAIKVIENGEVDQNKVIVDTIHNDLCHIEFVNKQINFKNYSHNDYVVNHIKSK